MATTLIDCKVRGDETEEQLATLCAREAEVDVLLLEVSEGLSRLHASRRLFTTLKARGVELPVVHHLKAPNVESQELALRLGMQVGSLLGDGLVEEEIVGAVWLAVCPAPSALLQYSMIPLEGNLNSKTPSGRSVKLPS